MKIAVLTMNVKCVLPNSPLRVALAVLAAEKGSVHPWFLRLPFSVMGSRDRSNIHSGNAVG